MISFLTNNINNQLKKSNSSLKKIKFITDSTSSVTDDVASPSGSTVSNKTGASYTTYKPPHKFEAGRRFHDIENISYFFPNDDDGVYFRRFFFFCYISGVHAFCSAQHQQQRSKIYSNLTFILYFYFLLFVIRGGSSP